MKSVFKAWVAAVSLTLLAACGGGGTTDAGPSVFGNGGANPGTGATAVAADLSLALSAPEILNSGSDTVTATVLAVDVNRNTVAGIPVTIRIDEGGTVQTSATITDTSGSIKATLGIGSDRRNRVMTVTAISGSFTRTAILQVKGTKLSATVLPAVLAPSTEGKVQYKLVDSSSFAMADQEIVVAGLDGAPVTGRTNLSGEYLYTYTVPAAASGTQTIRASAGGVESSQNILVQGGGSAVTIPAVPAGSVRSASVRANPSVVSVNLDLATTNQAEIRALFLGDANRPIENIRSRFDLDGDLASIGGTVAAGTNIVYSNASGVATTAYIPASRFSPTDKVTVRVCWDYVDFAVGSCPNAARTTLTVVSDALSVSVGTNALIETGTSGLTYVKRYVVQVNDSAGVAKADVQVTPLLDLTEYRKGFWFVPLGGDTWTLSLREICPNEDLNRNGVAEVYSNGGVEDANASYNSPAGRAALDPPKAAVTVSLENGGRTNSLGQMVLRMEYPQNFATWIQYNLVVSAAGVAGTEGRASHVGILPAPADVFKAVDKDLPFTNSPFGRLTSSTVFVQTPDSSASASLCVNKN